MTTCVCGHIHYESWEIHTAEADDQLPIGDNKPFIYARSEVHYDGSYGAVISRTILICPKCGTLKVNI